MSKLEPMIMDGSKAIINLSGISLVSVNSDNLVFFTVDDLSLYVFVFKELSDFECSLVSVVAGVTKVVVLTDLDLVSLPRLPSLVYDIRSFILKRSGGNLLLAKFGIIDFG